MRAVLLAHDRFGPVSSKTATCILRYPRTYDTVAVVDRSKAGRAAREFVGAIGRDVPVVGHVRDALRLRPDVLVVGIAPRGGGLPGDWRAEIRLAIESGLEVHSGLHTFLGDDPELAALATRHGVRLWDVRKPPRPERIATGEGRRVRAFVVHTMGTDCNTGKMTVSVEIAEELKRRGVQAAFAATGQTGIMVGCDAGSPIDRVASDFVAGAAEELVLLCDRQGVDVTVVEGQGSIDHPAYSGVTVGLAHGCFPDAVVLCHQPTRTHHSGYETPPNDFPLVPLPTLVRRIEELLQPVSGAKVIAVSLNTYDLDERSARAAIADAERATGLPSTDPVRFGPGRLVDAVLAAAQRSTKEGARRLSAPKPTVYR